MDREKFRFWTVLLTAFITLVLIGGRQVQSQERYPNQPISILVAFTPGGGTDSSCRLIAEYLKKRWGIPVNVVNKPGGQTLPANAELYSSTPNGYTVLADQESCSSMIEFAITNLPFKVMDRTFISTFCITPFAFMVPSTSPYKSLKDAMEDAKKDPEHFTWISLGGTSGHDWLFRQFFKVAGVDVSKTQPVMVKGGTEAAAMVGGGHVKIGSSPIVSSRALAKSGALRYLAICRERNSEFPDVPTTAELGYPTINVATWVGFSGPPKLPSHIVDTWERTLKEIVKEPEFISRLAGIGSNVFYLDSAGMREFVKKQIEEIAELWGKKEK